VAGETFILDYEVTGGYNHNGGAIHFGPDGFLYAAHGDAVASGDVSQDMTSLLGKIIRLNPVPAAQAGSADAQVPADNPFAATATGRGRLIWALGLRNPFTFAFQPGTGRMFINDVGQSTYEEINEGKPGRNFGWSATEGPFDAASRPRFTPPLFAYGRSASTANAGAQGDCIVGGAFYNPASPTFPAAYVGKYFFADFPDKGWIRTLDPEHPEQPSQAFATNTSQADLAVGPDGAIWYTDHEAGTVMRIQYGPTSIASGRMNPHGGRPRLVIDLRRGLRVRWGAGAGGAGAAGGGFETDLRGRLSQHGRP
jgi:glucose/arabinose dehydrogenase